MHVLSLYAQAVIACSIAIVWVLRFPNVVKEFKEYGIPDIVRTLVGTVKIVLATLLVVAIWYPALALIPAVLMACLMACALVAHWRVRHSWHKYVPAAFLLVLSVFVASVSVRPSL